MNARLDALLRIARAAKELRSWDAIGALTSGDMPHAVDAQKDLRELDDALSAALSIGALAPLLWPPRMPEGAEELTADRDHWKQRAEAAEHALQLNGAPAGDSCDCSICRARAARKV